MTQVITHSARPAHPPAAPDSAPVVDLPTWKASLQWRQNRHTGERELAPSLTNATLILLHDRAHAGCWSLDTCAHEIVLVHTLPPVVGLTLPQAPVPLTDALVSYVVAALSAINGLAVSWETAARAIEAAAAQVPHNALRDHLDALVWDGVARLDSWLSAYLGAEASAYTSAVGRWWLISAIARAYRPGCQADHMLILEGAQATGKSTCAAILGGRWGLRKLPALRDYDRAAHALAGRWIVEVGELDAFRGAAATQIKDFLSLAIDHYRPPYGRYVVTRPRSCVYLGTTNEARYLHDATGARRFWPVRVTGLNRDALVRDRDLLLAEARDAYRAGEAWYPGQGDQADLVAPEQDDRYQTDAIEPVVADWLAGGGIVGPRDGVSLGEVLGGALQLVPAKWDRDLQQRVGAVLRRLGWTSVRVREGAGVRVRRYWRRTPPCGTT